jgi:hypothetical protein
MMAASRDEFDKVLQHAGLTTAQIKAFNDEIFKIPTAPTVAITVNTDAALGKISALNTALGNIGGDLAHALITSSRGVKAYATGGRIAGPGTPTSDSVPVMASRDEFILNAAASRAIGYDNLNRWNSAYGGAGTIVKPQMVAASGGTTAQAAGSGSAPLHIEHYYESSNGGAQQTATDLAWLLHARGVAA